MFRRHFLLALTLSLLASNAVWAYQPPFYPTAQQWPGPNEVLASAFIRLQTFVQSPAINDPVSASVFLETQMAPLFDFEAMADWAARPYYQQMNPEQRHQFTQGMKQRFIELIVKGMGPYITPLPRVRFYGARPSGPGQADVPMEVFIQPGVSMRGFFHLRLGPDGWKIFDASMNGISGLFMFRQFLIQQVRVNGPEALLP